MFTLTLLLALSQTAPAAGEGSAPAAPAPPSAADSIVAAAFQPIGTAAAPLKETPGVEPGTLLAPGLALVALALLALVVTRRKGAAPRSITIVESAALGPRRCLVIADVLGERLVLGVSEQAITVLRSAAVPAPAVVEAPPPRMTLLERLAGRPHAAAFEDTLHESIEDQELRAKLAHGLRGVVR